MTSGEEQKQRLELRTLRQRIAQADRSVEVRDQRLEGLVQEVKELRKRFADVNTENEQLKKENKKLSEQLAAMTEHKDKLAGFLFKTNQGYASRGKPRQRSSLVLAPFPVASHGVCTLVCFASLGSVQASLSHFSRSGLQSKIIERAWCDYHNR